jgi:hypothetical protein
MTKKLAVLLLASCLLLAACQPPPPPISPLPTAVSPLTLPNRFYLQLALKDAGTLPRPSSKKGLTLACGYGNMKQMKEEVAYVNAAWAWNWGDNPPLFPNVESIPNVWDGPVKGKLGGNSVWLMGPNEPNVDWQANSTPQEVAAWWPTFEATDRCLTSPQMSDGESGKEWIIAFYQAYTASHAGRPPKMDALAFHCYQSVEGCIQLARDYMAMAEAWDIKEVWVSEFSFFRSPDTSIRQAVTDAERFITWMEAEPMITRYAWYSSRVECCLNGKTCSYDPEVDAPLFNWNGTPSSFGKMYRQISNAGGNAPGAIWADTANPAATHRTGAARP